MLTIKTGQISEEQNVLVTSRTKRRNDAEQFLFFFFRGATYFLLSFSFLEFLQRLHMDETHTSIKDS